MAKRQILHVKGSNHQNPIPTAVKVGNSAVRYAQATGKPQAVLIHVDCGTLNLGGAIHNASKGRVLDLILAGTSPFTQEGEMTGSGNKLIHWIQDVFDQRGVVREYMKYTNEIRTGKNLKQMVH